jgi:hypothetical protein
VDLKHCPSCGQDKPVQGFGVRKRSPTGRKSWCRACEAALQMERYRARAARGLCIDCGDPVWGAVVCAPCRDRRAAVRAHRRASVAYPGGATIRSA